MLVVGDLTAGPALTPNLDDPDRLAEYHGSVVEVATRNDEIRATLSEYDLTFVAR